MLMLCHFDHNRLTIMPSLPHPPLVLLPEIHARDEITTMNSMLHRRPGEITACKSTAILDLKFWKRKFVPITGNDSGLLMDSRHFSTR
jgi:hypothetical protein